MFCIRCKKEYKEGIVRCPDCNSKLTGSPKDEATEYEAMVPVKVTSVANSVEAGLIMNLLQNNNIPCFKKDIGPGGWMNVKYGFSVFGEEIYVDERDYEKASIIIRELSPEQTPEIDNEADPESDNEADSEGSADTGKADTYKDYPFYRNPRILARILIITQIVIALLVYLISRYTA